ncbi:hypothetical protein JMG10_13030 [Nostoc ellipsosporum NOK]|nr:hypothetical protein [Nostoc ellipsosporum NOK]
MTATNIGKISITVRRTAYLCAAAGVLTAGPPAFSSTQGTLGATSTGSVSITASVANRAQITGLTDISFTAVDPATAATSAQSDCVWSNTATKGYSITATGSGTSGAFTLANGSLTVPYSVQWAASTGQTSGSALTAGTALGGLTTTAANPTCSTGAATTSSLIVSISAPNLQGMEAGVSYTGTLTLLVTPQ